MPSSSLRIKTIFSKDYKVQRGCHCCAFAVIELEPVMRRCCTNKHSPRCGKDVHPAGLCKRYNNERQDATKIY
jgi:hypothetical protein